MISSADSSSESTGSGELLLNLNGTQFRLQNVIYAPSIKVNILSTNRLLKDHNITYDNSLGHCLRNQSTLLATADISSGIPVIDTANPHAFYAESSHKPISMELAHRRLGHVSKELVRKTVDHSTGLSIGKADYDNCDSCNAGQMKATSLPKQATNRRSETPLEMIHMDLIEMPVASLNNKFRYLLTITDDYSRYTWSYGLCEKSIETVWPKWLALVERQVPGLILRRIRSDNGGEFVKMNNIWENHGIEVQFSIAYAHNQNGVAERTNQDILVHIRSVLAETNLPHKLWYEIAISMTYLRTIRPHRLLKRTPYETLFNRKPHLAHLRAIGSRTTALIPKEGRENKLQSVTVIGRLVGYEGTNQYRMWDPQRDKIVWVRDVKINESDTEYVESNSIGQKKPAELPEGLSIPQSASEETEIHDGARNDRISVSREIREEQQNEDDVQSPDGVTSSPYQRTASHEDNLNSLSTDINDLIDTYAGVEEGESHDAKDAEYHSIDPRTPNRDSEAENRRSQRHFKPSLKLRENQIPLEEVPSTHVLTALTLALSDDPKTYEEAIKRSDHARWDDSMKRELKALESNQTWQVVPRTRVPANMKILRGRYIYKRKRDGRYKARWVVKGFEQVEGMDYQETFAAVARAESYRMLIAIAVLMGFNVESLDVDTAFLYGKIDHELYIELPPNAENPNNLFCGRLNKSLYGLKQAPRIWARTLYATLHKLGFERLKCEHSIFYKKDLIIAVYVDDLLIIGRNSEAITQFKQEFAKHYDIKDMGPAEDYLGIQLIRNGSESILLSQKAYFEKKFFRSSIWPTRIHALHLFKKEREFQRRMMNRYIQMNG